MLERWLGSCPDLELVELDVAPGRPLGADRERVSPLALRLASAEEKLLLASLDYLAEGNPAYALEVAQQALPEGNPLPDLHLLQGALLLGEARIDEAVEPLRKAHAASLEPDEPGRAESGPIRREPLGAPTRRLYPSLRFLLRVSPAQLLPLYPDPYAAALLYAVALWRSGNPAEALEVLREAVREFGLSDELRLLAGQLHLARGDLDRAQAALAEGPDATRDAIDFTRCLYLAVAHLRGGGLRQALRELRPAVLHTHGINVHSQARARLVLAQVYGEAGLPLEALRHSGVVPAAELPPEVCAWVAQREADWAGQLAALSPVEIECMARADPVSLRIPEPDEVLQLEPHKLDIRRDPLAELKPTELSWVKRREQEAQIAELRAAAARGEAVEFGEPQYSPAAKELLSAVRRMQHWREARTAELQVPGAEALARDCAAVAQVRFDYRGTRAAPLYNLPCERRLALLAWAAGASLTLVVVLTLLRACAVGGL